MARCLVDVRAAGGIFKGAISTIVVKDVLVRRQAARAAHDWHTFPDAGDAFTWFRCPRQIKVHIIRNHHIQEAVSVVVHKRAASAPPPTRARHTGLCGNIFECAITFIAVEPVVAIVGDE